MLDHYTSQPLSFLCCKLDEVESTVRQEMNSGAVEQLRRLPSFMR